MSNRIHKRNNDEDVKKQVKVVTGKTFGFEAVLNTLHKIPSYNILERPLKKQLGRG